MASDAPDMIALSLIPVSFMSLPGELRNEVYHSFFTITFEANELRSDAICRRVESLRPALAILFASCAIKNEASSILWIDYVQHCHWGFGARHDDDDRMFSFCKTARKHNANPDVTFQKRNLNTTNMSTNILWLALVSTFDLPEDDEALQKLRENWDASHDAHPSGFVWAKHLKIRSDENGMLVKYTYHPGVRTWVQFRGSLALIDWREVFSTAESNAQLLKVSGD